jgi:hypothetical protein
MATHVLDYSEIEEPDEISGDEQYVLVWCNTHKKHEWHWLNRDLINTQRRRSRPDRLGKRRQPCANDRLWQPVHAGQVAEIGA